MPQLPLTMVIASGLASVMSRSEERMSDAPTPQFAPTASGPLPTSAATPWISLGLSPIIVLPAVSNDPV